MLIHVKCGSWGYGRTCVIIDELDRQIMSMPENKQDLNQTCKSLPSYKYFFKGCPSCILGIKLHINALLQRGHQSKILN